VAWHPDFMRLRFRNWTENLNLDWCISASGTSACPSGVVRVARRHDRLRGPLSRGRGLVAAGPMTAAPPGTPSAQRDQPRGFTGEADIFDTWFTSP